MNTSVDSFEKNVASLGSYRGVLNLRGLGANQTLILVDGRRVAGVSGPAGEFMQTDISGIPLSSVERIEILPASAGAIYGGSATGGVINIIRKHNFSGIDASVKYGNTFDSAARDLTYQVNGGFGVGRTQVTMGFTHPSNPLFAGDRTFAERSRQPCHPERSVVTDAGRWDEQPATGSTPNICAATQFGTVGVCNGTPWFWTMGELLGRHSPRYRKGTRVPVPMAGRHCWTTQGNTIFRRHLTASICSRTLTRNAVSLALRQNLTSWLDFQLSGMKTNSVSELRNPDASLARVFVPASAPNNPFRQDVIVNVPTSAAFRQAESIPSWWMARRLHRQTSETGRPALIEAGAVPLFPRSSRELSLFSATELSALQLSGSLFEDAEAGRVPSRLSIRCLARLQGRSHKCAKERRFTSVAPSSICQVGL